MAATLQDIQRGGTLAPQNSVPAEAPGTRKLKRVNVTGDNSYPTGGYALTPQAVGFTRQIDFLRIINDGSGGAGSFANAYWFWNRATNSLQLIVASTGAEVAAATNVTTATCDVEVEGI